MNDPPPDYFRRLCENLGFVCIAFDPELRVTFWNRQAELTFKRSAADVQGRSFLEALPEQERNAARAMIARMFETRQSQEMEIKYEEPGAERRTLVLIVSPVLDAEGRVIGGSASMRDISLRKKLSQELYRARRLASLGRVAGAVAHHFNNILGGMMTSIDCVLTSDSPRELRRTLRLLAQSIGRATRITNQLAASAASENQQVEYAELRDLVAALLDKLRRMAAPAKVELVADVGDVPACQLEAGRFMSIFESIAHNAIEAMPDGGTLTVQLRQVEDQVEVRLRDTGFGMSEEVLDRVFEPFFTTKGELGGGSADNIGLGLAAVHGLVAEMEGTITVDSKLGAGTTVTVRLPLIRPTS